MGDLILQLAMRAKLSNLGELCRNQYRMQG